MWTRVCSPAVRRINLFQAATIPLNGKIQVKDFQWPQTIGLGVAYQATDKLMIVADYKWINWADVMKNFKLTFTADATQPDPCAAGFAGTVLDATLFQNWKDQNVFEIGAGYKFTPEFTGRVGLNIANNPIPDAAHEPAVPGHRKEPCDRGRGLYDQQGFERGRVVHVRAGSESDQWPTHLEQA